MISVPDQIDSIDKIKSVGELNEVLFDIGTNLVSDKKKLALWIRGLQEAFAEFYILSKLLA